MGEIKMTYLNKVGTWIIGGVGAMYAFVTGNFDIATQVLVWIMLLDIVTGIMKGIQKRRLKSAIMTLGIMKKGAMILSIVFAGLLDKLLAGSQPCFVPLMTWLTIGNEGLSVTENFRALGVTIPKAIEERLKEFVDEQKSISNEK